VPVKGRAVKITKKVWRVKGAIAVILQVKSIRKVQKSGERDDLDSIVDLLFTPADQFGHLEEE
jgi:hypothetical protein